MKVYSTLRSTCFRFRIVVGICAAALMERTPTDSLDELTCRVLTCGG
ncbi:MAG: hypothetical protein ACRDPQ_09900 [Nocardioidaceae bacterium]